MTGHGQKFGGAILPDMMRWLWRDGPVSTDPKDKVERAFRQPARERTDRGSVPGAIAYESGRGR